MALWLDEKIHFHQFTKSSNTANLQPDFKTFWRITDKKINKCHGNNSGLPRNLSSLWRLHHSNVIRSIQSKALSVSDLSPPFCLQWSVHITLNVCLNQNNFRSLNSARMVAQMEKKFTYSILCIFHWLIWNGLSPWRRYTIEAHKISHLRHLFQQVICYLSDTCP